MNFKIIDAPMGVDISVNKLSEDGGIALYDLRAVYSEEQIPSRFKVCFSVPDVNIY